MSYRNASAAPPIETISDAFSRTAQRYDEFADDHPHLTRMREKVYAHLGRVVPAGSTVLELNAGTGTDAVALARRGYRVHATDIAPGMLARLRDKVSGYSLEDVVTVEERSFLDLAGVAGSPYDAVFSDLGGLNCVRDLRPVVAQVRQVLRPGGVVVWVLMPPICLWELATAFTGQFGLAFRRLRRGGTIAHLEGREFPVYYFRPNRALAAFGRDFTLIDIEGLAVATPTAESKNLARRHPKVYRALSWADERLSRRRPFYGWGDFYIVSLRYQPAVVPSRGR